MRTRLGHGHHRRTENGRPRIIEAVEAGNRGSFIPIRDPGWARTPPRLQPRGFDGGCRAWSVLGSSIGSTETKGDHPSRMAQGSTLAHLIEPRVEQQGAEVLGPQARSRWPHEPPDPGDQARPGVWLDEDQQTLGPQELGPASQEHTRLLGLPEHPDCHEDPDAGRADRQMVHCASEDQALRVVRPELGGSGHGIDDDWTFAVWPKLEDLGGLAQEQDGPRPIRQELPKTALQAACGHGGIIGRPPGQRNPSVPRPTLGSFLADAESSTQPASPRGSPHQAAMGSACCIRASSIKRVRILCFFEYTVFIEILILLAICSGGRPRA